MKKPCIFHFAIHAARILVLLVFFHPLQAQMWDLKQKLGSSDQQPADNLGISVSVSDSFMIAGAWWEEGEDGSNQWLTSAGAAYVYKLQSDGTWMETQKLISPHRETLGYFGFKVEMDGDYALIGAFNEDHSGAANSGRVYAYHRNEVDHWVLDDSLKISNPGNNDYFGASIAMAGDYALIGADGHGYDEAGANQLNQAGAAYLFKRQSNNRWTQIRKFVAQDRAAGDQFGKNVDIDEKGLVIGAFHKNGELGFFETGAAYAIGCNGTPCDFEGITSGDLQKLIAPDQNSYENFGWDVAISGDWLVAGKGRESDQPGGGHGSNTGTAYIFHWENGQWAGKQKVYAPDFSAGAYFGRSIAIDGPVCVIGAGGESETANGQNPVAGAGAAYIYELQENNIWMPKQKITGTQRGVNDLFGEDAVDVSGTYIAVGAWLADTLDGVDIIDGGAVYLFERDSPITAVKDLINENLFSIRSNPSLDGMLMFGDINPSAETPAEVRIYSMDGTLLLQVGKLTGHEFLIDLSSMPAAIYVVQVKRKGSLPQTFKWIRL